MSEIECIAFKAKNSGALQGFADIYIPKWGVEIFGVSLFMKNGHRWVSFPSRESVVDGEKKYWPYLRFKEKGHMDVFAKKVMDAIDRWCALQPIEKPFVKTGVKRDSHSPKRDTKQDRPAAAASFGRAAASLQSSHPLATPTTVSAMVSSSAARWSISTKPVSRHPATAPKILAR